jgi:hypothetical protein
MRTKATHDIVMFSGDHVKHFIQALCERTLDSEKR